MSYYIWQEWSAVGTIHSEGTNAMDMKRDVITWKLPSSADNDKQDTAMDVDMDVDMDMDMDMDLDFMSWEAEEEEPSSWHTEQPSPMEVDDDFMSWEYEM